MSGERRETPQGEDPLRPDRGRGSDLRRVDGGGLLPPAGRGHARGELLGCDPAAERDRRAAHGPCAEWLDAGRAGADEPDARPQHALDPRHRPRRHRHPVGGREDAARGRRLPPRPRPRGVRQAGLGVEGGVRLADRRAVQAPRRLAATTSASASPSTRATSRPSTASSSSSSTRATSTATTTWSTGTRARTRRSPTSRSRTARSRTPSTRSTTRSRVPTGS